VLPKHPDEDLVAPGLSRDQQIIDVESLLPNLLDQGAEGGQDLPARSLATGLFDLLYHGDIDHQQTHDPVVVEAVAYGGLALAQTREREIVGSVLDRGREFRRVMRSAHALEHRQAAALC